MIPPKIWSDAVMRRTLAQRDISTVYRLLTRVGMSQRRIAELIRQSQSEVSEIFRDRQIMAYDVLELPAPPAAPVPLPSWLRATDAAPPRPPAQRLTR